MLALKATADSKSAAFIGVGPGSCPHGAHNLVGGTGVQTGSNDAEQLGHEARVEFYSEKLSPFLSKTNTKNSRSAINNLATTIT